MTGRLVTLGESLGVLRGAEIGSLSHVSHLIVGFGGAESNVAIGVARLGAPALWIGRVGDDGLGRRILRELRAEGVTTSAVVDPAAPTALLLKENPAAGRSVVTYYRAGSAGSRLTPQDVDAVTFGAEDVLHLTGITPALSASARDAMRRAIARAREAGAALSYDVNHRASLWDQREAAAVHREFVAAADVVFAGDDEARLVLDTHVADAEELALGLAALGPAEAIVKLGARGAVAVVGGSTFVQPAVAVDVVVDTVGAGDAFVAGYLAERLAGRPAAVRLATAAATGAAACTHPGDWEGAPTREQLARGGDPVSR